MSRAEPVGLTQAFCLCVLCFRLCGWCYHVPARSSLSVVEGARALTRIYSSLLFVLFLSLQASL